MILTKGRRQVEPLHSSFKQQAEYMKYQEIHLCQEQKLDQGYLHLLNMTKAAFDYFNNTADSFVKIPHRHL